MIDLTDGIDSLTNFKRNTPAFLDRLRENGQPLVLTINGKAAVVVQDAESYQKLLELKERAETTEVLRQRLARLGNKKGRTADEFFTEFFAKNNISAEDR